jgi:hypothetical protein
LLLLYSIHHFINCKSRLEWGVFGFVHALVIAFFILVYSDPLFNFNLLCFPWISLFRSGLLHFCVLLIMFSFIWWCMWLWLSCLALSLCKLLCPWFCFALFLHDFLSSVQLYNVFSLFQPFHIPDMFSKVFQASWIQIGVFYLISYFGVLIFQFDFYNEFGEVCTFLIASQDVLFCCVVFPVGLESMECLLHHVLYGARLETSVIFRQSIIAFLLSWTCLRFCCFCYWSM